MPPPEVQIFEAHQIARGPDEIRGRPGSFAFIYSRYPDTEGNRWFVQPGHVGHEETTNSHGMLRALFGPDAGRVAEQVVTLGDVYGKDGRPTGETRETWDWHTIRRLSRGTNLYGRAGTLLGHPVVMLWGDPPGWEAMLVEVLGHLGIGQESGATVVIGNSRQYRAGGSFSG